MFDILWWNKTQDYGQKKKKNQNKFWNENVVKVKE